MPLEIPQSWTFKTAEVAQGFDQHVREQLPWYDLATGAIAHIARHYIPQNGLVYDVGCATGNVGRHLADTLAARHASLIGIDPSEEMEKIYEAPGTFVCANAEEHDYQSFDLCILFLVLMFIERLTLAGKFQAGVEPAEIIEKELSLAGVQRPISLDQLPAAPYQWFKFGDFAGYILEKPA